MNYVLRLKHWHVFLVLIFGMCLLNLRIPNNLTLTIILSATGGLIYISCILAIGHALYGLLPKDIEFNHKLFVNSSIVWMTGQAIYTALYFMTRGTLKYVYVFPIILIAMFFSVLYCNMFPARVLKSLENNEKADNEESFWYFLLFLFLPLGIWILQPKINSLITNGPQKTA